MISSLSRVYERTEEMQKRGIFANLFCCKTGFRPSLTTTPATLALRSSSFCCS